MKKNNDDVQRNLNDLDQSNEYFTQNNNNALSPFMTRKSPRNKQNFLRLSKSLDHNEEQK